MNFQASLRDDSIDRFAQQRPSRRDWLAWAARGLTLTPAVLAITGISGCAPKRGPNQDDPGLELIYGRRGLSEGRFMKPRAMVIDDKDQVYIVDMTGRIQVFDRDGQFLRFWNTPDITHGKPTGLGINRSQQIMVADTHYFQVLFYSKDGTLLEDQTIGGTNGKGPGEFGFVTDVVQDSRGRYWISEYGEFDRVQLFSESGEFLLQFGKHGTGPLEFSRPQSIALDENDRLWIADACNHRIQVVSSEDGKPELVAMFGQQGSEVGQFRYPYGLSIDRDGDLLVCEFGNHRVQKISREGKPIAQWGSPGREPSQLNQPWTAMQDSQGDIHVLDSLNHRVQRMHWLGSTA